MVVDQDMETKVIDVVEEEDVMVTMKEETLVEVTMAVVVVGTLMTLEISVDNGNQSTNSGVGQFWRKKLRQSLWRWL